MIIEHLQIGGFGALAGEFRFSPGLTVVCAPNEAGKTTLSAALMSLLYGTRTVVGRRRQSTDDERRYRPFFGGAFALGGVVALQSGLRLNVWRDFASDLCRVVDLASGKDVSSDYSRAPNGDIVGQKLLGLSRTQYEKIAYIRQDQTSAERDFAEFSDTLSTLFASEDGQGGTIQQALASLEQALTRFNGVSGKGAIRVDTEIARVSRRLLEVEEQLRQAEQQRMQTEAAFAEVAGQAERSNELEREIVQYEYLAALARMNELRQAREGRQRAQEAIAQIHRQIEELQPLRELALERESELSSAAAILRDREEKVSALGNRLGQAQAGEALLQRRLSELGRLAEADSEALRRVELALSKLGEGERREASARIDLQSAASALRVEGGDPEGAESFYRWHDGLPEADRRFLAEYPEKATAAEKGLALLSAKRAELERDRSQIESLRLGTFRQQRAYLFVFLGFFVAAVVVFFALDMLWLLALPPVFCLGFGVYSLVRMFGADGIEREREDKIVRDFAELLAREDAIDHQRRELGERLSEISGLYPAGSDSFSATHEMLMKCRAAVESWRQIRGRLRELQLTGSDQGAELLDVIRDYAPQMIAGSTAVESTDTPAVLERARRFQFELKEALALRQQLERVCTELHELQGQQTQLMQERDAGRRQVEGILQAGGLEPGLDLTQALAQYHERANRKRRLQELETETLPSAVRTAGDAQSLGLLDTDITALQQRLATMTQTQPWLQPLRPDQPTGAYESLARAARERLRDDSQALAERERAMALELERYQEQVPALLAERESLQLALARAERYQKAVLTAQEMMGGVAAWLHARWSPLLAQELAGVVRRFSERWRFSLSQDLRLGVSEAGGGALLDEEGLALHLSAGMRDQAYLALRLLLARKLGGGEPLPLILDDPFVNADDRRFAEGMEYLLELSAQNQIVVFSCHESRHQSLAAKGGRFAEALTMVQLK